MADKSQLSAEEIVSEIESLRQQMRSFAVQRAEGLIDASLQHDLVDDLKKRIAGLEDQQSKSDEPSVNSNHDKAQMVEEMLTADAIDTEADEDTHEHPEVPPIIDSNEAKHGEAHVIDELFEKGDTFELGNVTLDDKISEEAEQVEAQVISDTTSDGAGHGEAQVIDELFEKGDTFELRKVTLDDKLSVEDEQASTKTEPVEEDNSQETVESNESSQASDEPERAESKPVDELLAEDDPEEVTESEEPEPAESQKVREMITVEAETDEDAHQHSEAPPISDASDESERAETHTMDDLIIEEEVNPLRRDEDDSLTLGDFVEDVVVSSAMVKEPDYLDSIHEPNLVDIRDITKTYQMGELELEVLKGITLQVHRGELIAIMGQSGSGKSTLMNILGALDKPTAGEYFLDGVDVSKMNEKQLAEIRNQKIGFVFQSFNLLKRTSAIRQVELPLIYGKQKNRTRLAREALEAVGLGERLDHTPAELSGGQQQRVAIARALVTKPALILADEPTGNLDSRSGSEVIQIFQNLNRKNNITTIVVTHDVWIARHTDRVIMLRDGRIIADHRVKNPLVAGDAERPTETQELQAIFDSTYYSGDEEEFT